MHDNLSIQDKLFLDRTIVISGGIDAGVSASAVMDLLQFDAKNNKEEIQIFMAVEGANYLDVMAIYDTMNIVKSPISVTAMGMINGAEVIILAGATKGMRRVLKHTEISLSQPYGVLGKGANQQTEITIEAAEVSEQRRIIESIIAECTGQTIDKVHADCETGIDLTAEEALQYGIIDTVIG